MKTRLMCLLLTLLILIPGLAACAENNNSAKDTAAVSSENTGNAETDRSQTADSLPGGLDFGGASYRILVRDDQFLSEFYAEEASGDIVEDTVYNRNISVEERLNVKINIIKGVPSASYGGELSNIRTNVSAGDDAYDVIAGYSVHIVKLMAEGLFDNLNELQYLDFSQPWWPKSIQDEMTFNGSLYFMTGDICMTTISKALCMYFNKSIAESRNIGNIYDVVNANGWTFEKYLSLTSDVYDDLDGNSKADDNDLYGTVMTPYNSVDAFIPAFRQNITEMGDDGYPVLAFNTEKMVSIVEKIYSLLYETTGVHVPRNAVEDAATMFKMFKANQALFMMLEFIKVRITQKAFTR
jgi:ABC-type glycerol-3-phosphate transport system substrate-binding protein